VASDSNKNILDLQEKLKKLEGHLQVLLKNAENDIELASHIQKKYFQNRLPSIPGIKCLSRYISSYGLNADGIDVFTHHKGRDIWVIGYWTQSFGLNSLLTQTLVNLQTQKSIQSSSDRLDASQVFDDLSLCLCDAKKQGLYRLFVAKLDTHSLNFSGFSTGSLPIFTREQRGRAWQTTKFLNSTAFASHVELLEAANSSAPITSDRAHAFNHTFSPGTRFFYFGNSWSTGLNFEAIQSVFNFSELAQDSDLVDDLNHLFISCQNEMKEHEQSGDLSAIAFEIDARKLHLA